MLAQIKTGKGLRGAIGYCLTPKDGKEPPRLVAENIGVKDWNNPDLSAIVNAFKPQMEARQRLGKDIPDKHVRHVILPIKGRPGLSDETWGRMIEEWAEGYGVEGAWVAFRHEKETENDHCHLIFSICQPSGLLLDERNNYAKARALCDALETKYGLEKMKPRMDPAKAEARAAYRPTGYTKPGQARAESTAGRLFQRLEIQPLAPSTLRAEAPAFGNCPNAPALRRLHQLTGIDASGHGREAVEFRARLHFVNRDDDSGKVFCRMKGDNTTARIDCARGVIEIKSSNGKSADLTAAFFKTHTTPRSKPAMNPKTTVALSASILFSKPQPATVPAAVPTLAQPLTGQPIHALRARVLELRHRLESPGARSKAKESARASRVSMLIAQAGTVSSFEVEIRETDNSIRDTVWLIADKEKKLNKAIAAGDADMASVLREALDNLKRKLKKLKEKKAELETKACDEREQRRLRVLAAEHGEGSDFEKREALRFELKKAEDALRETEDSQRRQFAGSHPRRVGNAPHPPRFC